MNNSESTATATERRISDIMRHVNGLYRYLDDLRRNSNVINRRILPNLSQAAQIQQLSRIHSSYENMYCHTLNHIETLLETIREENYNTRVPPSGDNYAFVNGRYYHLTPESVFNLLQYAESMEHPSENRNTPGSSSSPSTPSTSNLNTPGSNQASNETSNVEETNNLPRRPERRRNGAGSVRRGPQHITRYGLGNRQWTNTNSFVRSGPQSRHNTGWNRPNMHQPTIPNWRSSIVNQQPLGMRPPFSNNFTNIFDNFVADMIPTFTNVPVFPSPQQVAQATQTITYGDIENPVSTQCPISLEPFRQTDNVVQIRQCGHIFHPQSLNEWFQENVRCPMCRYDIRDYVVHDDTTTEEPIFSAQMNTNFPSADVSNNITTPPSADTTLPAIDPSANNVNTTQTPFFTPPPQRPQNITQPQDVLRDSIFNLISTATGIPNLSELNLPTDSSGNTQNDESIPRQNRPPQPDRPPINPFGGTSPDEILRNVMTNHMNVMANPNAGQQILQNLFTNNVNNLTFDQSNNTLNFETFINGPETTPFGFMQYPTPPPTDSSNNAMDVD